MNTINERVAALIEELGITKTAFAEKLNVSQAHISKVCSGTSGVSDRTIIDICDKFSVNEEWLRHGVGEMFRQRTREEEFMDFLATLSQAPDDDYRKSMVAVLAKLTEEQIELVVDMAVKLADEVKKAPGQE